MASGGRGILSAKQVFGLTSLWKRRSAIVVYGMLMRTLLAAYLVFLVFPASTTNRVAAACRSDCRFSDAPLTKATLHAATFPHAGAALFADATLQAGNKPRSRQTLDKLVKPANTDFLHATIRSENMDGGFATGVSPLHMPARLSAQSGLDLHFRQSSAVKPSNTLGRGMRAGGP